MPTNKKKRGLSEMETARQRQTNRTRDEQSSVGRTRGAGSSSRSGQSSSRNRSGGSSNR